MLLHDSLSFDGVGAVVRQLMRNPRFEVITVDTPSGEQPCARLSGLTIVRKVRSGDPAITYEAKYKTLYMRDPSLAPYLRRSHDSV